MKAIQTRYMGYNFRSRLEARWAVFFEVCGLQWLYEKEGFDLRSIGPYLPDFWLEDLKLWAEIKPDNSIKLRDGWQIADQPELERVFALQQETGYPACLIEGTPGQENIYFFGEACFGESSGQIFSDQAEWVSCNGIITLDINRDAGTTVYAADYQQALPWFTWGEESPTFKLPVAIAYQAARSARFEHGENRNVFIPPVAAGKKAKARIAV